MRRLLPFLGGILLGLGIGIVIFFGFVKEGTTYDMSDLNQETNFLPVPSLDAPAPGFELENLQGESIQLDDFLGNTVLINFWATWCAPCRLEMPTFQRNYEKYGGDLIVLAVNNAEDPEVVQAFIDDFGLTFDVLLDPDAEIQRLYLVNGYPTTFIIDPKGVIRTRHIGLITEDQLDKYLLGLGISD